MIQLRLSLRALRRRIAAVRLSYGRQRASGRSRIRALRCLLFEVYADVFRRSRPFHCDPSPATPPPPCAHESTAVIRRLPREIVRCRRCQVAFATDRDPVERAREVHDQSYFEANRDFLYSDGSPNYFEYAMPRTLFLWRLGLSRFPPSGRRALDVGCGNGLMLRYLRFLGYEPWGVEISEWAADYARTVVGEERVTTGTLQTAGFPENHFRLATLVHVLEHLEEPLPTLTAIHRVLEPGGLLYVESPCSERDPGDYLIGDHFWFYCPDALRFVLTCAGFRDVDVGEGAGDVTLHDVPFLFALARKPG